MSTLPKVLFVGSNPSHLGSKCPTYKTLREWKRLLDVPDADFLNVSDEVTPGNKPLRRSAYDLVRLEAICQDYDKVVALGVTASTALTIVNQAHFSLPHPSPKNRKLNDKAGLRQALIDCYFYLRR